jgi:hypothetical protein
MEPVPINDHHEQGVFKTNLIPGNTFPAWWWDEDSPQDLPPDIKFQPFGG